MIHLTPRLAAAAFLIPPCEVMADIGTDHAYLPIHLLETGRIRRAIASDIHEGPARRAEEDVRAAGLEGAVSIRIGNGLATLQPGEAEGAVIAGMGGLMIRQILESSPETAASMDWLVLQPQNHAGDLRRWLLSHGYRIDREKLAREDRMLYQILRVRRGQQSFMHALEAETGLLTEREKDPLFPAFLEGLLRLRRLTIRGVDPDRANAVNREKRRIAIEESKELEAWLWKYTQKI